MGVPIEKFKGIPEIFAKAYGGVKAAVYSISGEDSCSLPAGLRRVTPSSQSCRGGGRRLLIGREHCCICFWALFRQVSLSGLHCIHCLAQGGPLCNGDPLLAIVIGKFDWRFGGTGDRTEHLHWRLTNGEGPKDLKPRSVVVLIGTNDLTHVYDVSPETAPSNIIRSSANLCMPLIRHCNCKPVQWQLSLALCHCEDPHTLFECAFDQHPPTLPYFRQPVKLSGVGPLHPSQSRSCLLISKGCCLDGNGICKVVSDFRHVSAAAAGGGGEHQDWGRCGGCGGGHFAAGARYSCCPDGNTASGGQECGGPLGRIPSAQQVAIPPPSCP